MVKSETLVRLQRFESRNVTYIDASGNWPIVWERAKGMWVEDELHRRYLDLTAAFGVAAAGHANRSVVAAGRKQMANLLHAMGDVHPHALKAQLAKELVRITFGRWLGANIDVGESPAKLTFGTSGFEAVEIALKTAMLSTGRPGIMAFEGGYHGLGYGALAGTHRGHFRDPFRSQLREFGHFVPYPNCQNCRCPDRNCNAIDPIEAQMDQIASVHPIGAVLVEPVQARGGIRIPSRQFLPRLRDWCDRFGAVLIVDEIYTGFGRTGTWFATEQVGVVPDLICLGKALTGGFPLSACVGRTQVMDAWPTSTGEAIHTSTYLGHPVGCAMALAQIAELQSRQLVEKCHELGEKLSSHWKTVPRSIGSFQLHPRHLGLMIGVEITDLVGKPLPAISLTAIQRLLHRGFILLPEGEHGEVISLTPPLIISWKQLRKALDAVVDVLRELAAEPSSFLVIPAKNDAPRDRPSEK